MKTNKQIFTRALLLFLSLTILTGPVYNAAVSLWAGLLFPIQAHGSLIPAGEKGGEGAEQYLGSRLLGQPFRDPKHLWGRIMLPDVTSFKDGDEPLLYGRPSNLSPAGDKYEALVAARVARIKAAHPEKELQKVPVDLVTCSGSGLDPHISPAAAAFQVARIARARGISEKEVQEIISRCTEGRFLGIFGEAVVNVLEVNLMLDGLAEKP